MEEKAVATTTKLYNIELDANDEIMYEFDNGITTFDPNAVHHVRPRLIQANRYIAQLNNNIGELRTQLSETRSRYFENARKLEEILQENVDTIDVDVIKAICEIYDIELKKTIKFKASIEVRGEVEVDLWADEDDYFEDVEFSVDFEWGTDGTITDVSTEDISER